MEHQSKTAEFLAIDHIAVAVRDLSEAVSFFCDVLGFSLKRYREVRGANTGMLSAEIEHNNIKLVLCQGTEPESQVSKLIRDFGPGIAHIAFMVQDVAQTAASLRERGLSFDSSVISAPGLSQIFSARDRNSGFSFEFIARNGEEAFSQESIQSLFSQLEQSGKF